MRVVRPLLLAVLIVGGFFYFTTYRNGRLQPAPWISQPKFENRLATQIQRNTGWCKGANSVGFRPS